MATYSFDIESTYDKAEVSNVFAGVQRDITSRYDFKNTPAAIDWLGDKLGYKITGSGDWQIDMILDIVRKHLANRNQSSKILDLSKDIVEANLKSTKEIPFVSGFTQERAKQVTANVREAFPKAKPQIQGDVVRVQSGSKDDLQNIMQHLRGQDFDFPLSFTNFR